MRTTIESGRSIGFDDAGSGPVVVLLHGILSDRSVFRGLMSSIDRDYRVINVDLRGHGGSDPVEPYNVGSLADDVAVLLTERGVGSATFVGWSMGGLIALDIASRLPELAERLILVDSTPCLMERPDWDFGLPASAGEALAAQLMQDWRAGTQAFAAMVLGETASSEITEFYRAVTSSANLEVALHCLQNIGGADLRPQLSKLPIPVATIAGENDLVCPALASAFLASALGGACEVLPGTGHAPFLTAPAEFEAALRRALARQ